MKKLLFMALMAVAAFALAACGGNGQAADTPGPQNQQEQNEATFEQDAEPEPEPDTASQDDAYIPEATTGENETPQANEGADRAAAVAAASNREEFIAAQGLFDNTLTGPLPIQRRLATLHRGAPEETSAMVICENGILWGMGNTNFIGRFGLGRNVMQLDVATPIMENVASVNGNYVITNGGTLWHLGVSYHFGSNYRVPLFDVGINIDRNFPGYPTRLLDNIVDVSPTGITGHVLALTSEGDVWAWGSNSHAAIVYPSSTMFMPPTLIKQDAVYVHAYRFAGIRAASFIVTASGDLYIQGRLELRRAGRAAYEYRFPHPTRVEGIGEVASVHYANTVITGIRTDGVAFTIEHAQVTGQTDGVLYVEPILWDLEGRDATQSVVVDWQGTHATRILLCSNGQLRGTGRNAYGIIDPDTVGSEHSEFHVMQEGVAYVIANRSNVFTIGFDGQVWGWGCNRSGQLGLGFVSEREGFTQIQLGY